MSFSNQSELAAVVWDNRGIQNPRLIPQNIDAFVRAQIAQQVAQSPQTVYVPVTWDETQTMHEGAGPSSTGLMDAPFIGAVTFIKIANVVSARNARTASNGAKKPGAGIIVKASNNIIGLTPGHTVTPCNMFFPAAIFPPNSLERPVNDAFLADPTCHIGLVNDGIRIEYLISYWKKTQVTA